MSDDPAVREDRWVEITYHEREQKFWIIINRFVQWGMIHTDPIVNRKTDDHVIAMMYARYLAVWGGCHVYDVTKGEQTPEMQRLARALEEAKWGPR